MTTLELLLTGLAEETAKTGPVTRDSWGIEALHDDAEEAGAVGAAVRRDIESRTGQPVVSSANYEQLRMAASATCSHHCYVFRPCRRAAGGARAGVVAAGPSARARPWPRLHPPAPHQRRG